MATENLLEQTKYPDRPGWYRQTSTIHGPLSADQQYRGLWMVMKDGDDLVAEHVHPGSGPQWQRTRVHELPSGWDFEWVAPLPGEQA